MALIKMILLKDWKNKKIGDIINVNEKAAKVCIKEGFAKYLSQSPEAAGVKKTAVSPDSSGKENISKMILDRWATAIITKDKVKLNNDNEAVVDNVQTDYTPDKYNKDIVLWIPPKDSTTIEFEDTPENNLRYIRECESSAKSLGFDYCITGHGGKSDYFRMFNIKNMPLGEDNKPAKILLVDTIMPAAAKNKLDKTNLGWTLSPVIGHPHWKPKYNGAIHKLIRGKNPIEHNNEYPKELLTQLKKSKNINKKYIIKIKQNDSWVEDFLLNYCCENELPKGSRHSIIEKNLAAYIIHRADREEIKARFNAAQKSSTDTIRTWESAILSGNYSNVSAGELFNYIKEQNLPYIIPQKQQPQAEPKSYILTTDEMTLLKNPQLLKIIDSEFNKKIVGEQDNRKAIFLNACGKFVENANIASYNLCLNSNSGAGKDFTCKNVLKIFPKDDVVVRSRISPTAFTYWHNAKFEPEFTWDGKALLLSDVSDNVLNHEVFKLMCSDGTYSTVVINQQAIDIIIKGKPVLFITTASANPNNEMLRRFPFLELNETTVQTKAIMAAQARAAALGITTDYTQLIIDALGKLKRVKVRIPFASLLDSSFPNEHLIMRTHFSRLLDYIKASAALHQFQRELDNDGYILATPQDYDIATIPLKQTTSNPMMIPLTKKQKMLLDVCKELKEFTVSDISTHAPFIEQSKIYDALPKLQEHGFLESELRTIEVSRKPVRYYKYKPFELNTIPEWKDIIDSCRKKGIEVNELIEGNKVIKGINELDFNNDKLSIDSQNSQNNDEITIPSIPSIHPPPPTFETKKNHKKDISKPVYAPLNVLKDGIRRSYRELLEACNMRESELNELLGHGLDTGDLIEMPAGYYQINISRRI